MNNAASKIGHLMVAALFMLMAAIQLNDPDPLYWCLVYLAVAAVPMLHAFERTQVMFYWVTCGLVSAGMLMSLPGFVDYVLSGDYGSVTGAMTNAKPYIEYAREFLGLVIAAVGLYFYRPGRSVGQGR